MKRIGLGVLVALLVATFAFAQNRRIYSNVHCVAESGDVVGTQLILTDTDGKAHGALDVFEGSPQPVHAELTGSSSNDRVLLNGDDAHARKLIGKKSSHSFRGTVTRDNGTEDLILRNVRATFNGCTDKNTVSAESRKPKAQSPKPNAH